jgi:hypothetical protein
MRPFGTSGPLTALSLLLAAPAAPAADPAGVQFFEQKIRPVLVKECYGCHSAEAPKVRGGLRVDSRAALLKGGDSGPAVVPEKPLDSILLKALRHDGLAMPPKSKLPDTVVADFERWIRMGAPDPRTAAEVTVRAGIDLDAGRRFRSFQPTRRHPVPRVSDTAWPRSDVDRFLLAAMEARGVRPVRDADRVTLIRRVTIDLIGLPPTPEEIDAFVNDRDADAVAFAKVVDRLLASPHFGERWGRHWLDVARYADSNGKDENLTFHEAWRYRDYVIRSFNEDRPFDRFVREQVAGDLLPHDDPARRDEQLTASGFLVLGPKVLADRDTEKRRLDVIDEQIDTVGRAFLGLTVGCARCHDHKFDPIPQADYYALAGIFASTRTLDGFKLNNPVVSGWTLRPLGGEEGERMLAARKEHQKKLTEMAARITRAKNDLKLHEEAAAMRVPGKLAGVTVDDREATFVGAWKASQFSKPYVGEGYVHDDKAGKGEKSATFTPKLPKAGEYEVFVSYTPADNRATNVPVTVKHAGGEATVTINQREAPKIDGLFRPVGRYRFEASGGAVTIANKGTDGYVIVDAVRFIPVGSLDPNETAMGVPAETKQKIAEAQAKLKELEAEEKKLKESAPREPPLVMAPRDADRPGNARINVRGNPHQLGDEVPRGFLSVASKEPRPTIRDGQSGRLELAEWIASADNPLTARVYVNRVWAHLFGDGLVRTVDNFGAQGEPPSHPELLDELAERFKADGWSTKKLVRSLVLSRAYALACVNDPAAAKADPENRLHWRANRRRVEAEVIRDGILMVSGRLDRTMGGSSVAGLGERVVSNESKGGLTTDAFTRRSVYLPILRTELPQVLEVFDFADPDVSTGKRDATTVPTQALFLMNSPFVMEQSRHAARRLLALPGDDAARLSDLYRRALGRTPTEQETRAALKFLADMRERARKRPKPASEPDVEAWTSVCLAVFGCTEFRFVE